MKGKMTVKEFLEKGYKFVEGDIYLDTEGVTINVGIDTATGVANCLDDYDWERFILKAKALEESDEKLSCKVCFHSAYPNQKYCGNCGSELVVEEITVKNVKTTYEEVEFTRLADAAQACEEEVFYYTFDGVVYTEIKSDANLVEYYFNTGSLKLYQKVETTIPSVKGAKDACDDFLNNSKHVSSYSDFSDFLCDGCDEQEFDLEFINICRVISETYGKLEIENGK